MLRARYVIEENDPARKLPLVIRDVGVTCMSVTNDAEAVVEDLVQKCHLPRGRRLFYYDSDGQLDELLVEDGRFAGFAPGPRRA